MNGVTILSTKTYEAKVPKKLLIADNYYLEEIDEINEKLKNATAEEKKNLNKKKRNLNNLICDISIPRAKRKMYVDIMDVMVDSEMGQFPSIITRIYVTPIAHREQILKVYRNDKYYSDTLKKDKELGCDTASFIMFNGNDSIEFDTGADGYYGRALIFKDEFGANIELSFDKDMFTLDDVISKVMYILPEETRK